MDHNLMVSFEVRDPLREGALIVGAIEELGAATRIFGTTWYVRSDLAAPEAARSLWNVMDPCDALVVIDVSHNATAMFNVDDRSVQFMARYWHRPSEREQQDVHELHEQELPHVPLPRVTVQATLLASSAQ